MSSSATVRIRQTTTTTQATSSVLVVNSGYLRTRLGLLKLLLLAVELVALVLLLLEAGYWHGRGYGFYAADLFLTLAVFGALLAVGLMLLAALLSLGTATLLPKTSFDFLFHFVAAVLLLVAGLWLLVGAIDYNRATRVQAAAVLGLVAALLHLVHAVLSYRLCITN